MHQAAPTRAASVVRAMMDGHRPAVWLSDRYSAQQGHGLSPADLPGTPGARRRVCARGQRRPSAVRLKLWLGPAFDLATPPQPRRLDPGRASGAPSSAGLAAILAAPTRCELARAICKRSSPSPRPAADLFRLPWPGRGHEQRLRARPTPRRYPAQSHQRLSRDVGRSGRGRCPHRGRHRPPCAEPSVFGAIMTTVTA